MLNIMKIQQEADMKVRLKSMITFASTRGLASGFLLPIFSATNISYAIYGGPENMQSCHNS